MHAIKKYQYELAILVILLLQFVYEFLASVYPYIFVNYIADYSLGFGPRKLIGSLCRAVLPSGYGELHVVAFITFWYAILMGLATYMMSGFIRNGIGRGKNICFFAIFFVTLYLLSPMRPEYLFVHTNFGRMDAYMLIFALCFILLQGVEDKCFFLLSTILMSLSCLAHQIFVCTFLPLYCGLYVYRIYKSPVRIQTACLAVLSMLVLTGLFLFEHFMPQHLYSFDETVDILRSRTSDELDSSHVFYEYFAGMDVHFKEIIIPGYERLIIGFVSSVILLTPLIYVLVSLWKNAVRGAERAYRFTVVLINLSFTVCIPAFILTVDYGRWFSAIFISQFLLIGWLVYSGDVNMGRSVNLFMSKVRDNKFLTCMLLVYTGSLGCFADYEFLPGVQSIINIYYALANQF